MMRSRIKPLHRGANAFPHPSKRPAPLYSLKDDGSWLDLFHELRSESPLGTGRNQLPRGIGPLPPLQDPDKEEIIVKDDGDLFDLIDRMTPRPHPLEPETPIQVEVDRALGEDDEDKL
jgi:hypothetical protein